MSKKGMNEERDFANMFCSSDSHCERVAGSGSRFEAVADCVLFTKQYHMLVEVKATKKSKFYIRERERVQLQNMYGIATRLNLVPVLAIKFKNRGWMVKVVDHDMPTVIEFDKNHCLKLLNNYKEVHTMQMDEMCYEVDDLRYKMEEIETLLKNILQKRGGLNANNIGKNI